MRGALRSAGALLSLGLLHAVNAACECGYSVNATSASQHAVYTELMENDFLHTAGDNITTFGWQPQEYNVSAKVARGPYGKNFYVSNVNTNPLKDANAWTGDAQRGGDAGLQLWVRGDHSKGYVSGAELAATRNDSLYGSYRVSMKMSTENGTCGAFFWFFNNSQEIDMEFLSKQFSGNSGVVNLVLQSAESVRNGYDAANTSGYHVQNLNFSPDDAYHEYRFDWSPDRVSFYVDNSLRWSMDENLPTSAGRLFLNHWSNGDPMWSAGPPSQDTAMTVSYIKAYFNSTDAARAPAYKKRCPTFDPSKVCQIPDFSKTAAAASSTYFFSQDPGHTPDQPTFTTTNGKSKSASAGIVVSRPSLWLSLLVASVPWALTWI